MPKFRALGALLTAVAFLASGCAITNSAAVTPASEATNLHSVSGTAAAPVSAEPTEEETPAALAEIISPTTGLSGTTDIYRPIIVQIENEPPARPQAGLQWADVVYESLIEADATRFTCVFNDILYEEDSPEELEVGPVRSSRYYHQWIQGQWDALYTHMGGSETPGRETYIWGESGQHIKERINGAGKYPSNSELLYRRTGTGKALEHTAYTELHADEKVYSYTPTQYQTFNFNDDTEKYADKETVDTVALSFWSGDDFVEYKYDPATNKLIRYMSGREFLAEETGEPVEVQNLIIQYTGVSEWPNEGERKKTEMFGTGKADFIIDGHRISGTWERARGANTPTVWRDDEGFELEITPGNTWIAIHPDNREVTFTYEDGSSDTINA